MPLLADLQAIDEQILALAYRRPAALVPFFVAVTTVGGGWGLLAVVPFALKRAMRAVTLWLLGAIVLQSALVSLVKWIVARARPCDLLGWCAPLAWVPQASASFPSGHAAGSFAFAAFVSVRAPRWIVPAVTWAALVAWSRCVLGVHYPSDVLAGSLLGAAVGALVARRSLRSAPPQLANQ